MRATWAVKHLECVGEPWQLSQQLLSGVVLYVGVNIPLQLLLEKVLDRKPSLQKHWRLPLVSVRQLVDRESQEVDGSSAHRSIPVEKRTKRFHFEMVPLGF